MPWHWRRSTPTGLLSPPSAAVHSIRCTSPTPMAASSAAPPASRNSARPSSSSNTSRICCPVRPNRMPPCSTSATFWRNSSNAPTGRPHLPRSNSPTSSMPKPDSSVSADLFCREDFVRMRSRKPLFPSSNDGTRLLTTTSSRRRSVRLRTRKENSHQQTLPRIVSRMSARNAFHGL